MTTPTRSNVQTTLGCQLIARTDTGREDDKVDFQFAAVGKTHGFTRFNTFLHNLKGVFCWCERARPYFRFCDAAARRPSDQAVLPSA